ncbi:hypothetical protein GUITHDRAFT_139438 [Guillardia theta CCMP2712]|uniref:Uncharacterized protein n=1 Tax=Guillardia theta (strain CCMP2712) TaxID=905079 RepID=L1J8E8_GUITC|nr:hypothetical protein GUITHDRAFT_139438 [Guillardia theta CCMP2712]EKX44813.1 hypothetical protein GUITHDRAFT_139438 [Guillardia theta CCMP2712]|eukprot:XP_005831793.1 hypothetical protein GUITHDRAFT_139438 [Guillardia theta CCMP2712]
MYPVPIDLTDESDTILLPVDEPPHAPQPSLGSNRADISIREEVTPQRLSQTAYTPTNATARVSPQDSSQSSKHTDFPTPSYSSASGAHAVSAALASPTKQAPTTGSTTATAPHPPAAAQSQTGGPTISHPVTAIPAGSSQVEHKIPSSSVPAQVKKEPTNANANSPVLSAPAQYISHGMAQTPSPYGSSDRSAIFHAPPRQVVSNTAMQQVAPRASNPPIYNLPMPYQYSFPGSAHTNNYVFPTMQSASTPPAVKSEQAKVVDMPIAHPVNWMKEKQLWFSSDMKPAQLLQNKLTILKHQQQMLSRQFGALKANIQKFREQVGRCPLSGRSDGFQTEMDKVLGQKDDKRKNDLISLFNLMNDDMKGFISLMSSAENLQDRLCVMSILDADLDCLSNMNKDKKWLSVFIDNDGLVPLAKWVEGDVDDNLLTKILDVMLQVSMEGKSAALLSRSKFFVNLNIPKDKPELRSKKNVLKHKWKGELPDLSNAKKEDAPEVKKKEKERPKEVKTEVKGSSVKAEKPLSPKTTSASQSKNKDEDLFKGMFGSKNKKAAPSVPAPSTMRMTMSERTAVMDDEMVISDSRGQSSSLIDKLRSKDGDPAVQKEEDKDKDGQPRKRPNDPLPLPLPVLESSKSTGEEEPQKKKRRISWAPDDKLCEVQIGESPTDFVVIPAVREGEKKVPPRVYDSLDKIPDDPTDLDPSMLLKVVGPAHEPPAIPWQQFLLPEPEAPPAPSDPVAHNGGGMLSAMPPAQGYQSNHDIFHEVNALLHQVEGPSGTWSETNRMPAQPMAYPPMGQEQMYNMHGGQMGWRGSGDPHGPHSYPHDRMTQGQWNSNGKRKGKGKEVENEERRRKKIGG